MQTRFTRNVFIAVLVAISTTLAWPAIVSRLTTFTDGTVLFASDLNGEFNNLVNNMNALDNDNIAPGANIAASKLSPSLAGAGISRDGGTGVLSVNTDNASLEVSSDVVQVKDNGITAAKIAQSGALTVIGNPTNATANVQDIAAATDGDVLRRSGTTVGFGQIARTGLPAVGQQVAGSSGAYTLTGGSGFFDISNGTLTITTTGRPVWIGYMNAAASGSGFVSCSRPSNTMNCQIKFRRAGTQISIYDLGAASNGSTVVSTNIPCSAYQMLDVVVAGTYTYTSQAAIGTTDTTMVVNGCKLFAYEL